MLRSFKFRLYPNPSQQELLRRHFGACRWVYNEALAYRKSLWEKEKRSVKWRTLSARLPDLKEGFPWLKEVTAQSLQSEVRNLHSAYEKFFREKKGYPKFKNKFGRQRCQFPQNTGIDFRITSLRLPKIGHVRYADPRTFTGQIKTVTVSRDCSGKFYASILVENGAAAPVPPEATDEMPILGIDLGLKHFATLSSGEKIDNPRFDPSSRLCTCGRVNRELTLADREWTCMGCSATHDRDILAAANISRFARQYVG